MKKTLRILLAGVVLVTGCTQKDTETVDQTTNTPSLSSGQTTTMCPSAIQEYLNKADKKGSGKNVKKGATVTVHYIGRLNDKEVFDTSIEEIAKACDKHNPARNYQEGLTFTVGAGQMIAGFDKGVEDMLEGQTKTITIPAAEAYGERSEEAIIFVPNEQIPQQQYEKGMKLMTAYGQTMTVHEVTSTGIKLDTNHELAGKDLIFDITVVSVN